MNFKTTTYLTLGSVLFANALFINFAYSMETITANTIEVTATRSAKDLMDVPLSVSVVTQEEIKKKNARNLSDLLRDVPGIIIQTNNDPTADRIRIRGEHAKRTLILVDGQKISTLRDVDGTQFSIEPSIIERIEVIKGPASVLYGAEAMGGVVNIITKKGGETPLQGELRTSFSSGTDGTSNSASVYGSNKGFNYRISGAYDHFNDYQSYHTNLPHSNKEIWNGNGFLSYDFNENFSAGGNFESFNREREYKDNRLDSNPTEYTSHDENRSKYAGFAELKNANDILSRLRLDSFYQTNERVSTAAKIATKATTKIDTNPTDSYGVSLQSDWTLGDYAFIIVGYEFLNESLDFHNYTLSFKRNEYRVGEQNTHAGFISVEHDLPADFALNYGMRYTHMQTQMDRVERIAANGAVTPIGILGDDTQSKPVFNIALVWAGIDNLALRALWSQGFRPATISDKYVDIRFASGGLKGNPDLEPETSDNFEVGARYSNDSLTADLALFYTKTENLIANREINDPVFSFLVDNIDESQKWGAELDLSYDFTNGITPYMSGTWLRHNQKGSDFNVGLPELIGRFGVRYYEGFKENYWRVNADLYVQGQNRIYADNGEDVHEFTTLNLSTGVEWGKEQEFFAQAEIINILDKKYNLSYNHHYQTGVNANLTFGYRF